jgi:diacylglycerol O-acyltransferase
VTPVNVRREDERGQLGNRITMLMVETPLDVRDPVERLGIIRERTEKLKRDRAAEGIEALASGLLQLPPPLLAAVPALGSPPNWVGNMVCTNVPGPMIPLYAVGHRLLEHYALAPLSWEMGLGCAVTSYDRQLFFTLQSDPEAAPDVDRLRELLEQSYFEMKAAAAEHAALPSTAAGEPERRIAAAERGAVA